MRLRVSWSRAASPTSGRATRWPWPPAGDPSLSPTQIVSSSASASATPRRSRSAGTTTPARSPRCGSTWTGWNRRPGADRKFLCHRSCSPRSAREWSDWRRNAPPVRTRTSRRPSTSGRFGGKSVPSHSWRPTSRSWWPPDAQKRAPLVTGTPAAEPFAAAAPPAVRPSGRADARAIGDAHTGRYLRLNNYRNNLVRIGWTAEQLEPPGSDDLFDAVVAWGDVAAIRERVDGLIDAGADQVVLNLVTKDPSVPYLSELRTLAALNSTGS